MSDDINGWPPDHAIIGGLPVKPGAPDGRSTSTRTGQVFWEVWIRLPEKPQAWKERITSNRSSGEKHWLCDSNLIRVEDLMTGEVLVCNFANDFRRLAQLTHAIEEGRFPSVPPHSKPWRQRRRCDRRAKAFAPS